MGKSVTEAIHENMSLGPNVMKEQDDDEIENAEDAIRELAQTDFDTNEESAGRMVELLQGIAFNDGGDDFIEELNTAVSEIAIDLDIVGEEDLPDDLVAELESDKAFDRAVNQFESFFEDSDIEPDDIDSPLVRRQFQLFVDDDEEFAQENYDEIVRQFAKQSDFDSPFDGSSKSVKQRLDTVRERISHDG